jgi:small subunit ribosomal protein S17|tara:strand:+ start:477 stop:710 length:234 start_codon:yes stop_codon:yes gene_type:complete
MSVKQKIGTVVSNKMDKTIVIVTENRYSHPLYAKTMKKTKRFMAHDENNECKIGDRVIVEETRPLSAKKRWALKIII